MIDQPPLPPAGRYVQIDLTPKSLLLVGVATLAAWLAITLFPVLLVVVVALMIAGMMAPFIDWLESKRLSRRWALAVAFSALFIIVAGLAALTLPPLFDQVMNIVAGLPRAQVWLAGYLRRHTWSVSLAGSVESTRVPELFVNATKAAISYSPQIVALLGGIVTAIFLAMYLLLDRERLRGALFALVSRRYHVRMSRILLGLETIVGGYMRGQALTSAMMAAFTYVVLMVADVPNAVALAVFAGLVDVLPYIGAVLATAPAVIAAFSQGPTTALVVLVVLSVYEEFESRFIIPRVYGQVLRLPSAIIVVALLAGGALLGILGALLALPVAAAIRLIVEELRFELPGEAPDPLLRAREELGEREYHARTEGVPAQRAAAVAAEIAGRLEETDPVPTLRRPDPDTTESGPPQQPP